MTNLKSLLSWPLTALKRYRRNARLAREIRRAASCRIIVGAGGTAENGWIATDVDQLNLLDPRGWQRFFDDASIEAILAEHVWEHLTPAQGFVAAQTCFRFLRPGGRLRVAVPDGLHPDREYIDWVRPRGRGPGADDHKVLYTYTTFRELFERAGFEVRLLEHFDEQGEFCAHAWDPQEGMIHRSHRFDPRNAEGRLRYTSLILDAVKPSSDQLVAETREYAA